MKKIMCICCAACLLWACGNGDEKKAQAFLQEAEQAWQAGDFSRAKTQIDSVRVRYPKAFKARKAGVRLMQKVELDEQQKSLLYLDSLWQRRTAERDSLLKGDYVLEKDTVYQETGNYFAASQVVEKNLNRTFLRAQVSESGVMSLTSIYCGAGFIHHTSVKVSSGDTYAETPASADIYETTDLDWKIEKADYPLGKDGGVIGFIVLNRENPIRVEFRGDKNYRTVMTPADRKAVADVYALAQVLASMEQIRKEKQEAGRKIEFINRRMKEAADKDDAAE